MPQSEAPRTVCQATGTSPGKLLIVGEHSAVFGQPAFAVPFPGVRARVLATPCEGALRLVSGKWAGYIAPGAPIPPGVAGLAAAIRSTLSQLDAPAEGLELVLDSTIPIGAGLGSSAAVVTALVRAISAAFGEHLDQAAERALVHASEVVVHGTPSGVDGCVVVAGAPIRFERGASFQQIATGGRFHLVVADCGVARDTALAVARVASRRGQRPEQTQAIVEKLGRLAEDSVVAWRAGDNAALGAVINAAHTALCELDVSSELLDRLVGAANAAGALGAKLTGAGLGGCVLALAPDATGATLIDAALIEAGAVTVWHHTYVPEAE